MNGFMAIREQRASNPCVRVARIDDPAQVPTPSDSIERRQFLAMERAFSRNGGLCGADDIARQLRMRTDQPISMLARWIVSRAIVCFDWRGQTFVPMFQFDLSNMSVRAAATSVIDELAGVFNSWELALWFAQPNTWLNDTNPVEWIQVNPQAVIDAARADRFVARG